MKEKIIEITKPKIVRINVTIKGITSLLVNRIYPEDIKQKTTREKDEDEIFKRCLYPVVNGKNTFPAAGIKRCITNAAHTYAPSIPKTRVRGSVFIPTDFCPIVGSEPTIHKVGGRNPNKRSCAIEIVRAEFKKWKITFPLEYDANGVLELETILNLIAIAGNSVGIGGWRPACDGDHGRFEIESAK